MVPIREKTLQLIQVDAAGFAGLIDRWNPLVLRKVIPQKMNYLPMPVT
jgi:hypothetical protein